ncbi:hypothetical protein [Chryseobacterium sp. SL1]|uniref:hypothetical protein n=1 Tax=Chryseobacterium sp. SL1 TaxID=2995159 RepID=UPI002274E84E|nr:hypothetical protein [Chryseobacterium sp. SL1]MCY1660879.1 hypothetical protein [Chryseobacterium sp. SL1]
MNQQDLKKEQIKQLLKKYFEERKTSFLNQKEFDSVVEELSKLNSVTTEILLKYISKISYLIKESVDFSDTNYLLVQIVNTINSK